MAIELPQLVQRLVLDASGFKRGAEEAETSFRRAATASERAAEDVGDSAQRNYRRAAEAAQEAAERTDRSWDKVAAGSERVGRSLSTFITLPLVGVAAASVKTAGEFESTLNQMAAVAGVPGPELDKLGALAKKMGADTVFSANEAAGSMLNLAKAGVSTADIMGGGVQATLALAAAGGIDLATAATVAGNAMNTFGLSGENAAMVSDALAGAANASSADISDLAMALSQGGLAANAAGLSIQETTAVLAAFADQGLRGSDAGTSLKTFLLNLVPSSKEAAAAFAELGVKFTDASGAMLPIRDIAEQLRVKTAHLSDEQRTLALQTMFGTDAYRAALVLSKEGAAGLDEYTAATSRAGTAQEVADARMKGWTGTWEQFKGSLETAALSIGQVVIPAITPLIGKVKELADGFAALDPEQAKTAVQWAGIAAAAGPLLFVFGKIAGLAGGVAGGIRGIGVAAASASMSGGAFTGVLGTLGGALGGVTAGTVLAFTAGIAAIGVGLVVAYKKSEAFRDIVNAAFEKVGSFFRSVWEGQLQPIFKDFMRIVEACKPVLIGLAAIVGVAVVGPIVAGALLIKGGLEVISVAFQVMAAVAETVGRNLGPIWGGIQTAASALWQAVQAAWDGITSAINGAWQKVNPIWQALQTAWDGITSAANTLWRGVQTAWDGITNAINAAWQAVQPVWQGLQSAWDGITTGANMLWQVVQTAWDGITTAINAAWQVINGIFQAIYGVVHDILAPVFLFWQAVAKDVWNAVENLIKLAWEGIKFVFTGIVDYVRDVLSVAFTVFRTLIETVWNAISAAISFAWNSVILPLWNAIVAFLTGVFTATWNGFLLLVETVWTAISTAISFAWNSVILPVWNAVVGFVTGVFTATWNGLRTTVETVWDAISAVVDRVWRGLQNIWDAMINMLGGPLSAAFNAFRDLVSGVWEAFKGAADTAWNAVRNVIGRTLRGIGNLVSGFLRVVASIADVVGMGETAGVLRRGADSADGWGEGFERGGTIGGGFKTDGPRAIVGEGNPMYPEFVIPTDPKYRSRATGLMIEAHEKLFPRHAAGTNRVGTEGGGGRGRADRMFQGEPGLLEKVWDFGSDVVEGVSDALVSAASWTIDQVRKLGRAGLEKAWPKLPVPDHVGGIAPAGVNTVRQGVLDAIWAAVPPEAPAGAAGGGGVPYDGSGRIGSGWEQITGYLDSKGQPYQITSTVRNWGTGSLHEYGKAVDMVGNMAAIFNTLAGVPGINELFYDPMGYYYDEGARYSGAIGGHDDHVHAATFDNGGILRRGKNVLINNTGAPEPLVPAMAFGGMLPGPNPWENPFWNPGAWAARNVDEFATGTPAPDAPTQMDLDQAPMYQAPWTGPGANPPFVIAEGAFSFNPSFSGEVSPAVLAEMNRQLREAIREIIMAMRQGVR